MASKKQRKLRRWAVRERFEYILLIGNPPLKIKGAWIGAGHDDTIYLSRQQYERWFPEEYHLPPGGGPVEIRFADEA